MQCLQCSRRANNWIAHGSRSLHTQVRQATPEYAYHQADNDNTDDTGLYTLRYVDAIDLWTSTMNLIYDIPLPTPPGKDLALLPPSSYQQPTRKHLTLAESTALHRPDIKVYIQNY